MLSKDIPMRPAKPALYRYLPFALFMAFIGLDEIIRLFSKYGFIALGETTLYYLYPLKVLVVACLLYRYRREYREIKLTDLSSFSTTVAVFVAGLLVFFLWIHMDWTLGVAEIPRGFNPTLLPDGWVRVVMTMFRVGGAVLIVPLMEELFWRSFLIRYLINEDFLKVPVGTFSRASFLLTVALFGFEHNYILAGMMAGIFYNLILYRTKSITNCVLAHAVTNLALSLYVLSTGKWQFW
jgi:CAAX prenyl protease-like protein